MADLLLMSVAYNAPWVIGEQIRLLRKHLRDDYRLVVFDNSSDPRMAAQVWRLCQAEHVNCIRVNTRDHQHHEALNKAAVYAANASEPFFGFLDHDVLPCEETALVPLIAPTGFLALGQTYRGGALGGPRQYPWPGFFFVSRAWLNTRTLDFTGIRGKAKRDDGDTGSGLWRLFTDEDWRTLYSLKHGYEPIREPDGEGLQSWGVERIGAFVHLTNVSGWMQVRDPEGRERLLRDLVSAL